MRYDLCGARTVVLYQVVVHLGMRNIWHSGATHCAREQREYATHLELHVSKFLEGSPWCGTWEERSERGQEGAWL